jgi:hypothetical protein
MKSRLYLKLSAAESSPTRGLYTVIPLLTIVIPAKAGIQRGERGCGFSGQAFRLKQAEARERHYQNSHSFMLLIFLKKVWYTFAVPQTSMYHSI